MNKQIDGEKIFDGTDEENGIDEEMKRILAEVDAQIARMSPEELEKAADFKSDPKFYEFLRKHTSKQRKEYFRENRYEILWRDIKHRNWKRAIKHIKEIYF